MAKTLPEPTMMLPLTHEALGRLSNYEKYHPALRALCEGKTIQQAAATIKVSVYQLRKAVTANPKLLAELQANRQLIREELHLQVLAMASEQVNTKAKRNRLKPKDIVDLLRVTRPASDAQVGALDIKMPARWSKDA